MTLLELFQLLKKHLKLVITLPVVCAIAMGIVSFVAMDNTYTACHYAFGYRHRCQGDG